MEKRFFLALTLSIAVFLLWSTFFAPVPPPASGPEATPVATVQNTTPKPVETVPDGESIESISSVSTDEPVEAPEPTPTPERRTIRIESPMFIAELDTLGGRFTSWKLKKHKDTQGELIEMISADSPKYFPGELRVNNNDAFNETVYTTDVLKNTLQLENSDDTLNLELSARLNTGEQIVKSFTFYGDNYLIDMSIQLKNTGRNPISGRIEYLLPEKLLNMSDETATNRYIRSGPVFWNGTDRELPKIKKLGTHTEYPNTRWAAIQESYFFAGIAAGNQWATGFIEPIARNPETDHPVSALAGLIIDSRTLSPGDAVLQKVSLIIGPKKYDILSELGIGIENIVDFGWIEPLGKLFYYILIHSVVYLKNYGLCIILITFCVKLLLFPLSHKQMHSMKKMQAIQPQMKAIQEKYRKDPQKQQQELGKLYKEHGVNPLGGCLPMFVQFPIFIALYQVLMNLIEMRNASFILVPDLSQPYIPLVILMGISMIVQQKMTPTTGDPRQARMMMLLPIVFTAMFWSFPAGLVLYWLTNNILTIAQQMIMNRGNIDKDSTGEKKLKARTRRKIENK